jgi:SlyX protein
MMLEPRVVELETKLAYQEAAVETLSAEVARQQRQIEQMQTALRRIAERLPPSAEGAGRGSLEDELPPHY